MRTTTTPSGAPRADWISAAWVAGAVIANAALITTIGFVLACTLCFVLAVRGLRRAAGKPAAAWPELFRRWAMSQGLG